MSAKEGLEYAVLQYKQCKAHLQKAISSKSKNERHVNNKMTLLSEALDNINKSHIVWVSKLGLSDEDLMQDKEKFNMPWLGALWEEVDDF